MGALLETAAHLCQAVVQTVDNAGTQVDGVTKVDALVPTSGKGRFWITASPEKEQ